MQCSKQTENLTVGGQSVTDKHLYITNRIKHYTRNPGIATRAHNKHGIPMKSTPYKSYCALKKAFGNCRINSECYFRDCLPWGSKNGSGPFNPRR